MKTCSTHYVRQASRPVVAGCKPARFASGGEGPSPARVNAACLSLLALSLSIPQLFAADSGVLLPVGAQQPDSAVFSLDEMWIDVHIDNGDARVSIRQIFGSHSGAINEGTYVFALPTRGVVSD